MRYQTKVEVMKNLQFIFPFERLADHSLTKAHKIS